MRYTVSSRACAVVVLALSTSIVAACGGGGDTTEPPAPAVSVSISPSTATLAAGGTQSFTATVNNSANTAVTWSATGGSVDGTGNSVTYTAPIAGGSYTITATSSADGSKSATATVTVTPVSVILTPTSRVLYRGEPTTFSAEVTGTSQTGLTWSATCGTLTGTGATVDYVPPSEPGTCDVVATSTLDSSKTATSEVTVRAERLVTAFDDTDDGACTFAHCSLREALVVANATPGLDTIRIGAPAPSTAAAALRRMDAAEGTGTIMLTSGLPIIVDDLVLLGGGASTTVIDANATVASQRRVLSVDAEADVTIRGVTLRGGLIASSGGGLRVAGGATVLLAQSIITDNEIRAGEGGGARVQLQSTLRLDTVQVHGNRTTSAVAPGGGISATLGSRFIMTGGSINDNSTESGQGAGLRATGAQVTMTNVEVRRNQGLGVVAGFSGGAGMDLEGTDEAMLTNVVVTENKALPSAGGGIRLNGASGIQLLNCTILGNEAAFEAGLSANNVSDLSIEGTVVRQNRSTLTGLSGVTLAGATTATIVNSAIEDNETTRGFGGGLSLSGSASATLHDVTITGNIAKHGDNAPQDGGGVWASSGTTLIMKRGRIANNVSENNPTAGTAALGSGGGLVAIGADITLDSVEVSGNTARIGGGLAFRNGSTLTMRGGEIRDNRAVQGTGGGASFTGAGGSFTDVTIEANTATTSGGGLHLFAAGNVSLTSVTVRDNSAEFSGGGINVINATTLNATDLALIENSATSFGGGLSIFSGVGTATLNRLTAIGNTSMQGGGAILNTRTMVLTNSTLANNSANGPGAALYGSGQAVSTVRNSTFSGNNATTGGAIFTIGSASLTNVTVVGNTATDSGAGIISSSDQFGSGSVGMTNVLLSGNQVGAVAQNCTIEGTGTITSSGHNLSDDTSCAALTQPGDKPNTPAGVSATLADNGGPTLTHALLEGSAAIDAGLASACTESLTADQRGFARVGVCDIGAFEFGAAPAPFRTAAGRSPPARRR